MLDSIHSNLDKLKNLKGQGITKDVFVNFFKNQLDGDNKKNVLEWYSHIKRQMAIKPKLMEVNNLLINNYDQLKSVIDLEKIKDVKDVYDFNKQKINELKANNDLKNFTNTKDGQNIAKLLNEIQKTDPTNYEDKNKDEDEKLKFVLKYVYSHLDEKISTYSLSTATYKTDLLLILKLIMEKLDETELKKNQSVNSWYVNVLIGFLAITCTGFVWFIFGPAKDKKTIEDVKSKVYKPKGEYDQDRDTRIDIIAGVFSVLISALFVFSIIFAWAVAIQIILGIILALQAVIGIVKVFKYEKDEFQLLSLLSLSFTFNLLLCECYIISESSQ